MVTFDDLKPFTKYTFTAQAETDSGRLDGPSASIPSETSKDGKLLLHQFI